MAQSQQLDSWTRIWLSCAAMWAIGLVAAGLFVNSYSSTNGPGETLVQVNGLKVLIPLSIPLVGVAIVALAMLRRRRSEIPGVGVLVWIVFAVLAVFVVLGAFSIGPFIAPVMVFVILAITRAKSHSELRASAVH